MSNPSVEPVPAVCRIGAADWLDLSAVADRTVQRDRAETVRWSIELAAGPGSRGRAERPTRTIARLGNVRSACLRGPAANARWFWSVVGRCVHRIERLHRPGASLSDVPDRPTAGFSILPPSGGG